MKLIKKILIALIVFVIIGTLFSLALYQVKQILVIVGAAVAVVILLALLFFVNKSSSGNSEPTA